MIYCICLHRYLVITFQALKAVNCESIIWTALIFAVGMLSAGSILEELVAPEMSITTADFEDDDNEKGEEYGKQEGDDEAREGVRGTRDKKNGSSDIRRRFKYGARRLWLVARRWGSRWYNVLLEAALGCVLVYFSSVVFIFMFLAGQ